MPANSETAKFDCLLQLAQEQIQALESDDMFAFDQILASKRALIESLTEARSLIAVNPALETIVARIQDADKTAQRLLNHKVEKITQEMAEINRQGKARGAYRQPPRKSQPLGLLPNTPRYLDVLS